MASIRGDIDWVVILNVVIWGLGALWVLGQINSYLIERKRIFRFSITHRFAILTILGLYLSLLTSLAPKLTAFRVTQLMILLFFTFLWIQKYGIKTSILYLFFGFLILNILIGLFAIFWPNFVLFGSRLRGDFIADAGSVSVLGLIILLTIQPYRGIKFLLLFSIFIVILIFSRTRSAYVAFIIFLALSVLRQPQISALRRFLVFVIILVPFLIVYDYFEIVLNWIIRDPTSISTLSSRIPSWHYFVHLVLHRSPLIGLGFYTTRIYKFQAGLAVGGTAHSAFVEIFAGGGIVAFTFYILLIFSCYSMVIKLFIYKGYLPIPFLVVSLFNAIVSIGIVSDEAVLPTPTGFAFWLLVSLIPELYNIELKRRLSTCAYCFELPSQEHA